MNDPTLPNTYTIQDFATLQVIAEPLRAQIFEILADEALTVRQVSERLGLTPSRLYYHINLLEQHRLITVIETRTVANLIEKVYRAVASNLEVADSLLDFSSPETRQHTLNMVTTLIDATREDVMRSIQARLIQLERGSPNDPKQVLVNRTARRMSREKAQQFIERIRALIGEFDQADEGGGKDGTSQLYAMTVVFNPSIYFDKTKEQG